MWQITSRNQLPVQWKQTISLLRYRLLSIRNLPCECQSGLKWLLHIVYHFSDYYRLPMAWKIGKKHIKLCLVYSQRKRCLMKQKKITLRKVYERMTTMENENASNLASKFNKSTNQDGPLPPSENANFLWLTSGWTVFSWKPKQTETSGDQWMCQWKANSVQKENKASRVKMDKV